MAYKYFILLVTLSMNSGCSFINVFKARDDYLRNFMAEDLKTSIDSSIGYESAKGPAPGFSNRSYSEENWNKSWNRRIHAIHSLGKRKEEKAYKGPSGEEFIRYIIEERRRNGLPELIIEERNKDRVPKDLLKE